jgi:Glycosyltransferase family 87
MLFLVGLGLAVLRIGPLPSVNGVRLSAPWVLEDFRFAVYYPTQGFWHGVNPYNSRTYLARYPVDVPFAAYAPATFLVYLPAGFLGLPVASVAYFVLTLILTVLLGAAAVRISGYGGSCAAVLATSGAILLSRPGQWNLLLGQVTLPAVLGVYAAVLLAQRAPAAAGIGIAFSLLKPTFGIPLIALVFAQGARRAVLWGLGLAALVNLPLLAVLVRMEGGVEPFLAALLRSQTDFAADPSNDPLKNPWRIDLLALISLIKGAPIGTAASLVLAGAVIGLAYWALVRLRLRADENSRRLSLGIICCAVLLVVYHKAYDLLLLTLPAVALVRAWKLRSSDRRFLVLQAGLLTILAGNYLTTESALNALRPGYFARLALLSVNAMALLALFGLFSYEALARSPQYGPALAQIWDAEGSARP